MSDRDARLEAASKGMLVALWASLAPERRAVVSDRGTLTYAELNGRANQLARALRRRGLGPGDAVALICTNRAEFVEVYCACVRSGVRITPVNWHLKPEEAAYIVADCEAKVAIVDPEAEMDLPPVADILTIGDEYEAALAAEDPSDLDDPVVGLTMLYTSGTTGRPKGVHRPPLSTDVRATTANIHSYERDGTDVHLCTGPLYHAAPLAISMAVPLNNGVTIVLMERWDAKEALRLIERERVTHTHMVATMFHRLLALPEDVRAKYDLSSLRWILHGAAPCPVHVKQRLIEWLGPIVHEYYAATEGVGTTVDAKTWLTRPGTVGRPEPPDQVLVGDEVGDPLPPNQTGLLWLKAPEGGGFRYFKDDEKTARSYRPDRRYFTLGDVGYMDDEGFLFVTDRSAELIISGGVNIYPAEIDAALLSHPAVGDAATIGVPNEEWGEEVRAVVEPAPGVEPSAELAAELAALCRSQLAAFKCPRAVDFIDCLPRQDNGKIYKRLLRERYREASSA